MLTVVAIGSLGKPAPERAGLYAAFVRDLHAHLGVDDRARIRFLAGYSEARRGSA